MSLYEFSLINEVYGARHNSSANELDLMETTDDLINCMKCSDYAFPQWVHWTEFVCAVRGFTGINPRWASRFRHRRISTTS